MQEFNGCKSRSRSTTPASAALFFLSHRSKALVEAMSGEVDLADYADQHSEQMAKLIDAKVQGRELVSPPAAKEPEIINLMDALKESVKRVKKPAETRKIKAARMAAAKGRKRATTRRRKSG